MILGHSCDGGPELLNSCYLVVAHALEAAPRGKLEVAEERFTAFCLPGMLPGPYMGYNQHGLVMSANSISTGIPEGWLRTRKSFFTLWDETMRYIVNVSLGPIKTK